MAQSNTCPLTSTPITYEYRAYGYAATGNEACNETGTWTLFGPPELTLYAFEPTANLVTKFYNNPTPILGVWNGNGTPDGYRVKFALHPAIPGEIYTGAYDVATAVISNNQDCTP